jgi:hypothetical protein
MIFAASAMLRSFCFRQQLSSHTMFIPRYYDKRLRKVNLNYEIVLDKKTAICYYPEQIYGGSYK